MWGETRFQPTSFTFYLSDGSSGTGVFKMHHICRIFLGEIFESFQPWGKIWGKSRKKNPFDVVAEVTCGGKFSIVFYRRDFLFIIKWDKLKEGTSSIVICYSWPLIPDLYNMKASSRFPRAIPKVSGYARYWNSQGFIQGFIKEWLVISNGTVFGLI